jgi:hypothetical protein
MTTKSSSRAQRGITLLKELKKAPHRIVAADVVRHNYTTYTLYSDNHQESGEIASIHITKIINIYNKRTVRILFRFVNRRNFATLLIII